MYCASGAEMSSAQLALALPGPPDPWAPDPAAVPMNRDPDGRARVRAELTAWRQRHAPARPEWSWECPVCGATDDPETIDRDGGCYSCTHCNECQSPLLTIGETLCHSCRREPVAVDVYGLEAIEDD